MSTATVPELKRIAPLISLATALEMAIAEFGRKVNARFPIGSDITFAMDVVGNEVTFEGKVANQQYVEAERPAKGVIVEVDERTFLAAKKEKRLASGRLYFLHLHWSDLRAEPVKAFVYSVLDGEEWVVARSEQEAAEFMRRRGVIR